MAEFARRAALVFLSGGAAMADTPGFYDFTLPALEGGSLPLAAWRGRPVLVVNTASFCGYTPQYEGLQALADRFAGQGLVVLGVPSNDFNQESAEAEKVRAFCDTQFGITFPLAAISQVRGAGAVPLFRWLAERGGGPPRWNFHKYLVGRDGMTVQGFVTAVEPESAMLLGAVRTAVA